MFRALIKGLAVFIAGPVVAFGALALGCEGANPLLGVACGHNAMLSLVAISVVFWFVLIMALSVHSALKNKL